MLLLVPDVLTELSDLGIISSPTSTVPELPNHIRTAAQVLSALFDFKGEKADPLQSYAFPRVGLDDQANIPTAIKDALIYLIAAQLNDCEIPLSMQLGSRNVYQRTLSRSLSLVGGSSFDVTKLEAIVSEYITHSYSEFTIT